MGIISSLEVLKKRDFPNAIWKENPTNYPYVRMSKILCCNQKDKGSFHRKWKIIGYTKAEYIGKMLFERIVFWLKDYDRGMPNEKEGYGKEDDLKTGLCPTEAVKFDDKEIYIPSKEQRIKKIKEMSWLKKRFFILNKYNFTCQYCGRKSPEVVIQVDHKKPKLKGGNDNIENLTVSCRDCNLGKRTEDLSKNG